MGQVFDGGGREAEKCDADLERCGNDDAIVM